MTVNQAGFSETGANSLNLNVAQQTTNSVRTVIGAELAANTNIAEATQIYLRYDGEMGAQELLEPGRKHGPRRMRRPGHLRVHEDANNLQDLRPHGRCRREMGWNGVL